MCPGCGTNISNRALSCPQCGYVGDDPSTAIAKQSSYEMVPRFQIEIERWNPSSKTLTPELIDMPVEARRRLFGFLGNWELVQTVAPALADSIKQSLGKEQAKLVANLPAEIMKKVQSNELRFGLDKNGQILPHVLDEKGKYYKQVRLDWEKIPPDVTDSLRHLQTQVAIAAVLAEVHSLSDQIEGIRIDLQNDRLALADGAWDKLMQARVIEDSRLRETLMIQAISSATDAKRTLMRNFSENVKALRSYENDRIDRKTLDAITKRNRSRAADAFNDLVQITNAVRVEGTGYAMLGHNEASKVCLDQFREFIQANRLDERDTLLAINSYLPSEAKMPSLVDQFEDIGRRIVALDGVDELESVPVSLLEPYRPVDDTSQVDMEKSETE